MFLVGLVASILCAPLQACSQFKKSKECKAFIETVNTALQEIDKRPQPDESDADAVVKETRSLAARYEKLSTDVGVLGIETEELKAQAVRYQGMATQAAETLRAVANAVEKRDSVAADAKQKEFDSVARVEDQLVNDINTMCLGK